MGEEKMAKKKKFKFKKLIGFVYFGLAIGLIYYFSVNAIRVIDEKRAYEELLIKRDALLLEKANLTKEVELLSDEDYVTRYARDNYIFSKDGEQVVKLPESTK